MTTVDILTTSVRPEMMPLCAWLWDHNRLGVGADTCHRVRQDPGKSRAATLKGMVAASTADFFILADDDDYIAPGYLRRCLDRISDAEYYGEIPERYYLMTKPYGGAYGESTKRPMLFQTFTLYRRGGNPFNGKKRYGPHTTDLIVMRGLMADPSTAITTRKNTYSPEHWPALDSGNTKLREWLADDPGAFDRYMEMSR